MHKTISNTPQQNGLH